MRKRTLLASAVLVGGAVLTVATAQEQLPTHLKELLELGMHPGHTYVEEGREMFHKPGPNGKSCATCHGQDGAKLRGAYAKIPRYYNDIGKVANIDTRILACMTKYMGYDKNDKKFMEEFVKWNGPYRVPLASYVASLSNGQEINVQLNHPEEKRMYEMGEKLWYMRVGARDFSCALCHTAFSGMRIRLQGLPNPVQAKVSSYWPVYRFGSDVMWTMEDRIRSCYEAYFLYLNQWDEKKDWVKEPPPFSEWVIALDLYLKKAANGATVKVPGLVR